MANAASRGRLRSRAALLATAMAVLALPSPAQASVTISAQSETYTGAQFFAAVEASDPGAVVLVEWDFDGDGRADVNRTDAGEAGYTYAARGSYTLRVTVTRSVGPGLVEETAQVPVLVHNGTPSVRIIVPDRTVAGTALTFRAEATDPDASTGGEVFTFAWSVDGVALPSVGPTAEILVDSPGTHSVALEVADEEGLTNTSTVSVAFGAPGPLEGRQGVVTMGLLLAAAAFGFGLVLVRAARAERKNQALRADGEIASVSEQAAAARLRKPEKVPFQAGAEAEVAEGGGARVVVGGTPAALTRTKECPVCHSAIDADLDPADCPYCKATAEAEGLEVTLAGPRYAEIDLSEVRALLQRARRERHLGRTEAHSTLVAQARERADQLLDEQASAQNWLERARSAVERASTKTDAERLDRAHSYLKLAESLSRAHQHAKVQRHARRCVEILAEGGAGLDVPDRCHACGGAIAAARAAGAQRCPHCDVALLPDSEAEGGAPGELEGAVRVELSAVRELLSGGAAQPDAEAWSLLQEAEAFEREAAWPQALELLRALRERFEKEREAARGSDAPADVGAPPAPKDS